MRVFTNQGARLESFLFDNASGVSTLLFEFYFKKLSPQPWTHVLGWVRVFTKQGARLESFCCFRGGLKKESLVWVHACNILSWTGPLPAKAGGILWHGTAHMIDSQLVISATSFRKAFIKQQCAS